ncbi:MAG: alpha/beta fold hydrolase [Paraglaciecola sp.]|uniref:alpha/beta fold hydrolase n=1 Tax=Paraglaciecola sp. TaxID=1920173 RepID=UPI003297576B
MPSVNYQVHSNDPSKPWIVLIHGLFGNLDNLSGLRRLFTGQFQVLCVDLPDHGKSDFTEVFSFESYAQLIRQKITELGISQVTLLGHSLGGKVAMKIALTSQDLVKHLAILDIAPVSYSPRHDKVFEGLNAIDLHHLESRKQAELLLSQHIVESGVRQFLLKSLYSQDESWHWRFNLNLLQRDYLRLSAAIESNIPYPGPVLFIKGQRSDYLLSEHKAATLELFPNSQSKMIKGVGHWLHAEEPNLCFEIVSAFIDSHT